MCLQNVPHESQVLVFAGTHQIAHALLEGKPPAKLHLVVLQVVGVIALFFAPAPILLKQGYLVTTGVVTAYLFTFIPEWTTWVMLVAMALYDLCAVLTPHGPLKVPFPFLHT